MGTYESQCRRSNPLSYEPLGERGRRRSGQRVRNKILLSSSRLFSVSNRSEYVVDHRQRPLFLYAEEKEPFHNFVGVRVTEEGRDPLVPHRTTVWGEREGPTKKQTVTRTMDTGHLKVPGGLDDLWTFFLANRGSTFFP